MPRIDVRGAIIPNDYKWFYEWFGEDATCPRDVRSALETVVDGDDIDVYINSPGGVIDVGSEIYTMLREASGRTNLKIHIVGEACSAASVIAMAGYSEMAPTALMMVHCVSTYGGGNHNDFEHIAEMLHTADRAMCTAYTEKTGMTEEEALSLMEHETWLTADKAKELGLVDAVMFEEQQIGPVYDAVEFKLPTKEQMEQVKRMMTADTVAEVTEPAVSDCAEKFNARMKLLSLSARRK